MSIFSKECKGPVQENMKPNFMVIGAAKCGTTSFCDSLRQHPDVFMPEIKETNFFSNDDVYARGWDWYESLFEGGEDKIAVGEGSTNYSKKYFFPNTINRLIKYLPELKLIYIVRNPMEQIRSLWRFNTLMGNDSLPFDRAVKERPNYLDNANYLRQINAYREHYEDENILVIFFEDFVKYPQEELERVFAFLGVNPSFIPSQIGKPRNVGSHKWGDKRLLKGFKQAPVYKNIAQVLPDNLKEIIRPFVKYQMKQPPAWNENTRCWVINSIRPATEEFLKKYGKPKTFWGLD